MSKDEQIAELVEWVTNEIINTEDWDYDDKRRSALALIKKHKAAALLAEGSKD